MPSAAPRTTRARAGSASAALGTPEFYEPVAGARTNLVVATTSGGDRRCRAESHHQRLDLPAVQAFLEPFE